MQMFSYFACKPSSFFVLNNIKYNLIDDKPEDQCNTMKKNKENNVTCSIIIADPPFAVFGNPKFHIQV